MTIIELPTPFAPLDEWRAFLAEMEAVEEKDDDVRDAIAEAREHIATHS